MTYSNNNYAGINKRFVAILVDAIILTFVYFIVLGKAPTTWDDSKYGMYLILTSIIHCIYFAGLESSRFQGTLGKKILGIIVTDTNGNKISLLQATGRYFAKAFFFIIWIIAFVIGAMGSSTGNKESPYFVIAGLLFIVGLILGVIGYLMAGFTPQKQALHDILSRCLVVNGSPQSQTIPKITLMVLAVALISSRIIFAQVPAKISDNKDNEFSSSSSSSISSISSSESSSSVSSISSSRSSISSNSESIQEPNFGKLISPSSNNYMYGVWNFKFAVGTFQHEGFLSMSGTEGKMLVEYGNGQGGKEKVFQQMTLWQSSQGLIIKGENPTDFETDKPSKTYLPDNFIVSLAPGDKEPTFLNVSFNSQGEKQESPVAAKLLGYPTIGIRMTNADPGAKIESVESDSPAAKADLQVGDIIKRIDDTTISNQSDAQNQIRSSLIGRSLKFEINRDGEELSKKVRPNCCVTPEQIEQENKQKQQN